MHTSLATQTPTDTLVIGGGLAGCAAAYYLARAGAAVTLVEQGALNAQASGLNAGSLHAQIPHHAFVEHGERWAEAFAPVVPLLVESLRLWRGLGQELGADLEVALEGGLLVAETAAQLRTIERKMAIERRQGLPVELLTPPALRQLAPYLDERLIGAAFCPLEGQANPRLAAPAFAAAAAAHGARILCGTAITGLERRPGGFIAHSSAGPIRAATVVNSAGTGAGRIAAMLGLPLPIEALAIQVSATEPTARFMPHLLYSAAAKLSLKQTADGRLLIGGGWPARREAATGRLAVSPASRRASLAVARAAVPLLRGLRLRRSWPAVVCGTADWLPILGEAPGMPGLFLNIVPWIGFTAGPLAARSVAELVLGRRPSVELAIFASGAAAAASSLAARHREKWAG